MPKLKPLKNFICDTCGEIIESPDEGVLMWKYEIGSDRPHRDFKIVHHFRVSPLAESSPRDGCYYTGRFSDTDLSYFTGPEGLIHWMHLLDVGPVLDPEYTGPRVANLREWTEIYRRLYIPHYEEARLYFERAAVDGYFSDANEISIHLDLDHLIDQYAD